MFENRKIPRRTFLQGLGASLALPSLNLMAPSARAAGSAAAPPVRFVTVFQPNGVYPKAWDVDGTGRDFRLSEILAPLEPLKSELLVLSNLNNVGGGHVQMTGAFLTGKAISGQKNATSLDQMIARRIGTDTPLPSIELGTEPPRQGSAGEPIALANTVSWSSETTRLSPEINPRVAFDRLFRTQNSPEARRAAADRRSVVDLVLEDARALRQRAGAEDRVKLDEYLESVRSVEVRIERSLDPPRRSWTPPTRPAELLRPEDGIPVRRDEHLRMMIDLLVLALWTDTTRVGTLMTAHGFSRQNFGFLEGVRSDHHGMSHHKNQPEAVAEYTKVSRWYVSQFAYLLDRLRNIDEGGGSLLDHSVVLYGSGMKDGNGHVRNDLPILLAGRGSGMLDPGRHVAARPNTPLANLHLSLAQKFGLELDSFNGASTGTVDGL